MAVTLFSSLLVRLDPKNGDPLFHMGLPGKHLMQDGSTLYLGGIRLWRRGDNGLLVTRVTDNDPSGTVWTGQVLALDDAGAVLAAINLPAFEHDFVSEPAASNIDGEYVDVAWDTSVYRLRLPLAP